MVILALVTLVIGVVLTTSIKTHKTSHSGDEAYSIAREKLAEFQDPNTDVRASGSELVTRTDIKYLVNWLITEETGKPNKAKIWVTWDNGNRQVEIFGYIDSPVEACPDIDPNNPFETISLSHTEVPVNSDPNTVIGTFSVPDDPDEGDLYHYEIYPLTDFGHNHEFKTNGDKLETKVTISTMNQRSIQVKATDCGDNSLTKIFYIDVTTGGGGNDAPTGITLSSDKITENKPAYTEVGTFTTTDNNGGDIHVYTLEDGTGGADNDKFQISANNKLETKVTFNFEAPKYNCYIRVKSTENNTTDLYFCFAEITIAVIDTNDAPEIPVDPTVDFTAITTADTDNAGDLVFDLVASSISDADAGALEGVAIQEILLSGGNWQYSINNGSSWTNIVSVASNNALLLRPVDKVRYIPSGVPGSTPYIRYYAWDQTSGNEGDKVDATNRGVCTAFSEANDESKITVTSSTPNPCDGETDWDPAQIWNDYTTGDKRVNDNKLWSCKNPTWGPSEPSSAAGQEYGWDFVANCN